MARVSQHARLAAPAGARRRRAPPQGAREVGKGAVAAFPTILAMKGPGEGWAFAAGSAGDHMALTVEAINADRAE